MQGRQIGARSVSMSTKKPVNTKQVVPKAAAAASKNTEPQDQPNNTKVEYRKQLVQDKFGIREEMVKVEIADLPTSRDPSEPIDAEAISNKAAIEAAKTAAFLKAIKEMNMRGDYGSANLRYE